ncbi:MAG: hypothetical protein GQ549_00245 [Gammaproteobacteria bacterium]|nr:hypothetical protein [Gammaproteobacteria bacterium]
MKIFIIALLFVLITAIILIVYTMQREHEFKSHNSDIQTTSVHGAAYAIDLQLQNKHRHVRLFLDEYSRLFNRLYHNAADEITLNSISKRLQQRFPDFYTFTITDSNGGPTLLDVESLVGETCQRDLGNFASNIKRNRGQLQNKVFVHPKPFHYHYDIMAPLHADGSIFFTSFYLNDIIDILKTHELPGQTLMLVRRSDPDLIEVTSEGARDKLSRDIRLTPSERNRIVIYKDVAASDWRLVNLPDAYFEKQYLYALWKEVVIILSIVILALFLMIFVLFRRS